MIVVLVIDDDPYFREGVVDLVSLVVPTARILEAENGRDGLNIVQQERPDYIFMDFQMPVMDGHDTALALSENPERDKITLIGMSSADMSTARLSQTRQLCNYWWPKPFTLNQVAELFHDVTD